MPARNAHQSVLLGIAAVAGLAGLLAWSGMSSDRGPEAAEAAAPTPATSRRTESAPSMPDPQSAPAAPDAPASGSKQNPVPPTGPIGPNGGLMMALEDQDGNLVWEETDDNLELVTHEEGVALAEAQNPWNALVAADPELEPLRTLYQSRRADPGAVGRLIDLALGASDPSIKVTPPARERLRIDLADMDGNGRLDRDDSLHFLTLIGQGNGVGSAADFNRDGVVDSVDLEIHARLVTASAR